MHLTFKSIKEWDSLIFLNLLIIPNNVNQGSGKGAYVSFDISCLIDMSKSVKVTIKLWDTG